MELKTEINPGHQQQQQHPFLMVNPPNNQLQQLSSALATTPVNFSSDPRMIAELQNLKEAVKSMQNLIQIQTTAIADQSIKINAIYEKLFWPAMSNIKDFPIKSVKNLEELDEKINSEPQFEADLKVFLSLNIKGKVSKNFKFLITDNFLSEVNWNGRKNMIAIKKFTLFSSTLYGSVHNAYNSYEDYENDIKNSIKKGKNRLDQKKHQLRRVKNKFNYCH